MNVSSKSSLITEAKKSSYIPSRKAHYQITAIKPVSSTPYSSLKGGALNNQDSESLERYESHLDNILSNFYDLKDSFYKKRKKNNKKNLLHLIEEFVSNFNSFVVTLELIDNILNSDYLSIIALELAKNKELLYRYGIIVLNDYELELKKYILLDRINKGDIENLIGSHGIINELLMVIKSISITKHDKKTEVRFDDYHGAIIDSRAQDILRTAINKKFKSSILKIMEQCSMIEAVDKVMFFDFGNRILSVVKGFISEAQAFPKIKAYYS